ncbi:hypothetical protein QL285_015578 [Trifolium repens]|nr:hypothetical protein QL285_015578 [Trifolium repens]
MISSILHVIYIYHSLQIICGAGRKLMQGFYDPYAPQRNRGANSYGYGAVSGSGGYSYSYDPPGVPEHIHIHNRDPNDAGGDTARIQMILLAYSYSPPNRSVPKLDPSANQNITNN